MGMTVDQERDFRDVDDAMGRIRQMVAYLQEDLEAACDDRDGYAAEVVRLEARVRDLQDELECALMEVQRLTPLYRESQRDELVKLREAM